MEESPLGLAEGCEAGDGDATDGEGACTDVDDDPLEYTQCPQVRQHVCPYQETLPPVSPSGPAPATPPGIVGRFAARLGAQQLSGGKHLSDDTIRDSVALADQSPYLRQGMESDPVEATQHIEQCASIHDARTLASSGRPTADASVSSSVDLGLVRDRYHPLPGSIQNQAHGEVPIHTVHNASLHAHAVPKVRAIGEDESIFAAISSPPVPSEHDMRLASATNDPLEVTLPASPRAVLAAVGECARELHSAAERSDSRPPEYGPEGFREPHYTEGLPEHLASAVMPQGFGTSGSDDEASDTENAPLRVDGHASEVRELPAEHWESYPLEERALWERVRPRALRREAANLRNMRFPNASLARLTRLQGDGTLRSTEAMDVLNYSAVLFLQVLARATVREAGVNGRTGNRVTFEDVRQACVSAKELQFLHPLSGTLDASALTLSREAGLVPPEARGDAEGGESSQAAPVGEPTKAFPLRGIGGPVASKKKVRPLAAGQATLSMTAFASGAHAEGLVIGQRVEEAAAAAEEAAAGDEKEEAEDEEDQETKELGFREEAIDHAGAEDGEIGPGARTAETVAADSCVKLPMAEADHRDAKPEYASDSTTRRSRKRVAPGSAEKTTRGKGPKRSCIVDSKKATPSATLMSFFGRAGAGG